MAKPTDQQTAQCVGSRDYTKTTPKGEVTSEMYTFSLDGKEFVVFESKYFKATVGKYYTPVVDVYSKPYIDQKNNVARSRNVVVVNWQEVK